jgi:hypothetical protein
MQKTFRDFIWVCFSDETNQPSTKRIVGTVCSLTLCASLILNTLNPTEFHVSNNIVYSVLILALTCLSLTSVEKLINAFYKK